MPYTFDEIMDFHPDNKTVYEELKALKPRLVPFVGAGFTQFAYYSWSELLEKLAEKITNKTDRENVKRLIKDGKSLDAAQELENLRGASNLRHDLAVLFSQDKLDSKKLLKQPISLLPYFFKELIITTNFDQALEKVYSEADSSFDSVFLPGRTGFLNQLSREGGATGLYKLHGTVAGSICDYESIVFTKTQYDEKYGEDSKLTKELKALFNNKVMLFLGCSLNNDRTMELLQEVIQPGCHYYTIINCKESKRDEKVRQLAYKHIRAILYEGDRHEAVRVILEHLLEEIDPQAYQELPYHIGALSQLDSLERFLPKAEFIPFTGRSNELQQLNDFLGGDTPFKWWAIIGPGGSGKSRLAYEFQKKLPAGWSAHYLDQSDYVNLSSFANGITGKKLIIADYVQQHAKKIGRFMEQLNNRHRSLPVRVLLVERDVDANQDITAWTKQLYDDVQHERQLQNACYNNNKFLKLQPLCDADIIKIIEDYAKKLNKPILDEAKKRMLLDKLKSVDPDLQRPLYAMFLTDAYLDGKNPENWNRNEILDYVVDREDNRLKFSIRAVLNNSEGDVTLYNASLHLLSMATVNQDASLEDLEKLCPDTWKVIENRADRYDTIFASSADMLEQIGLAVRRSIPALRPDLIGEYYVYTWLHDNQDKAKDFIAAAWWEPLSTDVFFSRLLKDYNHLLNEDVNNWKLILPEFIPETEYSASAYAGILVDALYYCSITDECERQVEMQEAIVQKYPQNSIIAIRLAKGLVNLSAKQDEHGATDTIARLETLAAEHNDVTEIAIELANGLVNLSNKQDEHGAKDTIARLETIAAEYKDVAEIAIALAKGLVNLSNKQDKYGAKDTIARLETLADEHKDVTEIAIELANGLVNLSAKQDEQGATDTIARLETLAAEHNDVTEIAIELANGLVNLSNKQDEHGAKDTIARLETIAAEYKDVAEIAIALAWGRTLLVAKQDRQGRQDTI